VDGTVRMEGGTNAKSDRGSALVDKQGKSKRKLKGVLAETVIDEESRRPVCVCMCVCACVCADVCVEE
jgi:hypothetical protein